MMYIFFHLYKSGDVFLVFLLSLFFLCFILQ